MLICGSLLICIGSGILCDGLMKEKGEVCCENIGLVSMFLLFSCISVVVWLI